VLGPDVSELRLDRVVGDALRSYSRYWLETFRLPKMDAAEVVRSTREHLVGEEHVDAALAAGRGVILALPHSGNWDAAALWMIEREGSFTTVAERLEPAELYDRFVAYREGLGMEVLPLTGGDRSPVEVMSERLQANKVVALVADRDLSRNGIEVQFFGESARMPGGPALLAATTGAVLVPTHCYFTPGGWGLTLEAPIELAEGRLRAKVATATQELADAFARNIAAHPSDWHMLQPFWTADLGPRRLPAG
jgi:KDO2-lipid IV(A) lauroyltransferase